MRTLGLVWTIWIGLLAADPSAGQGTAPFGPEFAEQLKKRCRAGDRSSCYNLGAGIFGGLFPGTDAMAVKYSKTACDLGDLRGCTLLGVARYTGRGLKKDHAKAAPLLRQGCSAGVEEACMLLRNIDLPDDGEREACRNRSGDALRASIDEALADRLQASEALLEGVFKLTGMIDFPTATTHRRARVLLNQMEQITVALGRQDLSIKLLCDCLEMRNKVDQHCARVRLVQEQNNARDAIGVKRILAIAQSLQLSVSVPSRYK